MTASLVQLRETVARYYSQKIETHGATALGVDWPCIPSQELRFVQLLKICDFSKPLSVTDIGCGYGALFSFIRRRYRNVPIDYLGIDLSPAMISVAEKRRWSEHEPRFMVGHTSPRIADYTLASGIFNVKLNETEERWQYYIGKTLCDMLAASRIGFAVNFLGPAHPGARKIPELYRTPAKVWTRFCEQRLHMAVELVQGYGMQEFTLLARRNQQNRADE